MLVVAAFGYDAPVPFASGAGLASEGLPGWDSSPARMANTAVGVSGYLRSGDSDEWVLSAAGEWGGERFRGAFLYSYYALDTLFRQSAASLEGAFRWRRLVAGTGFGAVAEWIPGDGAWIRYRLKAGLSLHVGDFLISARWASFTDDLCGKPWVGAVWNASDVFSAYLETGFETFIVGSRLAFRWGSIETSYEFPGFALWFGVSLGLDGFNLGLRHGAREGIPAWNGVWLSKSFKK